MATKLERTKSPLIVIVGPTASGKTALAVELAELWDGEIICADSRTVYKCMDIGTAKPTEEERARVPHWGVDLVEPDERFTATDFKRFAEEKIREIRSRNKVPFLVGGTGLYIDAIIFDFQFGNDVDKRRRADLESLSIKELIDYCLSNGIDLPENVQNRRHLVNAIERNGVKPARRPTPIENTIVVGVATNKTILRERIRLRSEHLFSQAVVEEASIVGEKYGWEVEAMTGNIYPLVHSFLKKEKSLNEVKEAFVALDYALAKRQLTWFRRNPYIVWCLRSEVLPYLKEILAAK